MSLLELETNEIYKMVVLNIYPSAPVVSKIYNMKFSVS